MCGIAGYISQNSYGPSIIKSMVRALYHRGPDEDGYEAHLGFTGGMQRLSINGLKSGTQPFYSHDQVHILFYNGEIYNAPALRKELAKQGKPCKTECDGEVIVHLYDLYGSKAFEKLDGMFACAIWDKRQEKLILARDIAGEKPLFYTHCQNGDFVYSSDLNSLVKHPSVSKDINLQALWDMPTFLWVPEPQTIYQNIYALPRAHYLEFDGHNHNIQPYPNLFKPYTVGKNDDWDILAEKTRALITDAVHSRLLSDVPLGAFLSSGLDSSIVTTLAQKELGNLTTFSIGYAKDEHDPYEGFVDESADAAAYAEILGTDHHIVRITGQDFKESLPEFIEKSGQPYAVSSGLGVLAIAKAARAAGIKVLLSGDGADELFGGYGWYPWLNHMSLNTKPSHMDHDISMHNMALNEGELLEKIAEHDYPKRAWAMHYYASEQEKSQLFSSDVKNSAQSSLRVFETDKNTQPWQALDYIRQDRACYLPNEMMTKLDRMCMAHSVEGRPPFVAPSVLNFVEDLSYNHLVKEDSLKPLLREAFDDLLPESITKRPKHGFRVPIDSWLKEDWADLVQQTFAPSSALSKANLLGENAEKTSEDMLHSSNRVNGHSIFSFIILNMWLEGRI